MPILFKYLFKEYLKVFFLSILSFICVLLITRLKQIASFATLASDIPSFILFILYQIPHILPIAISISCLISSIILFQRMSSSFELTAFRSLGISLKELLGPVMLLAIFLSFINFYFASELTPICRYKSKELFYKKTSVNPIVLLQRRQKMSNIKDSYVEISTQNNDLIANDLLIISPNKSNGRLCLMSAKKLLFENDDLIGENVSLISYINSHNKENYDNLLIENQKSMLTKADAITNFIKSKQWDMNITSMPIKMLLIESKLNRKNAKIKRINLEIVRRCSLALSSFCFTFIGASFGISINRVVSKKNLITLALLSLLVLFSFTLGRAFKKNYYLASCAYILPQLITIYVTSNKLKKISKGFE